MAQSTKFWLWLGVPVYLLFAHLNHVGFWDDEAQTATFARNFNQIHALTGWDGKNLYAYRNGSILGDDFSPRQPPLDILVTALSFRLLGESETSARIPFALSGLLSLIVFVLWARMQGWGNRFALWATASYGLSVPFLLNSRQCRYYGLCLLFGVITLYLLDRWRENKDRWALTAFPGVFWGLYFSNFLIAASWLLAIGCVLLIFDRKKMITDGLTVACSFAAAIIVPVSHAIYFRIWDRVDIIYGDSWIHRRLHHLWNYPRDVVYFLPFTVLAVTLWLMRGRNEVRLQRILSLLFLNAIFLALFTPQPGDSPFSDVRFLILSLPLAAVCMGYCVLKLEKMMAALGWLVFFISSTTNLFVLGYTRQHFEWTLPKFILSIHQKYPTGLSETIKYLKSHTQPGETLFAVPDHFNYPLSYALPDLRNCCTLDKDTPLKTARELPAPLFWEENVPDWLILFERAPHTITQLRRLESRGVQYDLVESLSVFWEQTQRPEKMFHEFFPVTDFDKTLEGVYIYKKSNYSAERTFGAAIEGAVRGLCGWRSAGGMS